MEVKETATEVKINLVGDILFDYDKADLRPAAEATLTQVVGSGKVGSVLTFDTKQTRYWQRRLETCVHDPISKRCAIHFKLMVVWERRSLASATLCGSLLR